MLLSAARPPTVGVTAVACVAWTHGREDDAFFCFVFALALFVLLANGIEGGERARRTRTRT